MCFSRPFAALLSLLLLPLFDCGAQSVSLAGLRGVDSGVNSSASIFTAVQMDSSKNLYLLFDENDGVRILKLNPAGTVVLASIHLGAAGDHGVSLVLDAAGNVYVAGTAASGQLTTSGGGPVPFPAAQSSFVAGFTSSLASRFVTSTGGNLASATSLFVAGPSIYVTGTIQTDTLPVTGNAVIFNLPAASTVTGFVEAFNTAGSALNFATYLGGPNGNTYPSAITADAAGNIFITGSDTATGFPTVNAIQPELVGTSDLFLTKLSASQGFLWSTLLGSAGGTVAGSALALSPNGSIYVGVNATTLGLPITNSLMPLPTATGWAVVMNFAADGSAVNLATVLGDGSIHALALDTTGDIAATGIIHNLAAWPLTADLQHVGTAFLTTLSSTGGLLFSTRLGGIAAYNSATQQSQTSGNGIAIAADGTIAIAGDWQALAATSDWLQESLDLPMVAAPNAALNGTLGTVVANGSCQNASAACAVGYVAVVSPSHAPEISLSTDTVPNLSVRNVGSASFAVTSIAATGYSATTDCTSAGSLAPGAACNVVVTGSGPGSVTVQTAAGSSTFSVTGTATTAAQNAIQLQPKEVVFAGFGPSAATPQTVTASNFTAQPQILAPSGTATSTFSLQDGTCTTEAGESGQYVLPANTSCTLAAVFSDKSTSPTQDSPEQNFVTTQITAEPVNAEQFYAYDLDEDHSTNPERGLTVSATAIDFGTNYIGQPESPRTVVLANATSSAITPAFLGTPPSDPDFFVTDNCPVTLPAYASCLIEVTYAATVTAVDSATLALPNGDTLSLAGSTQQQPGAGGLTVNPSITVTPSTLTFGAVGVGDPSVSQSVTVGNTSNAAVAISLSLTAGFAQTNNCSGAVPANGSCTVQVVFDPTALGVVHGQLAITPSGSSPVDVALTAGGTNTVNFGAIAIGAQTTQWISLGSFEGNVTASVQGLYQTAVVNGYSYTSPPAIQFASSSTGSCTSDCYVGVRAIPSASGTDSGTLSIAEQGVATVTYPLTALSVSQSAAQLSGYSYAFGSVSLGGSSAPQFITIVNPGNTTLTISSVATTAGFTVVNGCGATLAGGVSCILPVFFVPVTAGMIDGTLTVVIGGSILSAQLSGNAASNPAGIIFSPTSITFASPSGPSTQTVTISNQSAGIVTVASVSAPASFFTVSSNCGTLQPGGGAGSSCTLQLAATSIPAGTQKVATVSVAVTSGSADYSYQIEVSAVPTGLGIASGSLQVTPATLSFTTQSIGQASAPESLTVTNNAGTTEPINVTAPAQFSVDNTLCLALAAGASCSIPVRFLPSSAGSIAGTIEIQGSGAFLKVAVTGIGLASTTLAAPAYPPLVQPITLTANPQGDGTTQLLQITNSGSLPLTFNAITATNLIVANGCRTAVPAGSSCNVTMQSTYNTQCGNGCSPYAINVPVTILSSAASSPDVYLVAQTQSGEDGASALPGLQLSSASLTFPQQAIGKSVAQSFQVESVNTGALVLAFTAAGDFSEHDNCNGMLPGYQLGGSIPSCTVTVTFAPTASGFRAGTLQVATNAGLQTVTLGGTSPASSGPVSTTTTLTSSASTVPQGQPVTLTAHVAATSGTGTPTGSVTFYFESVALTTVALQSGSATYIIPTSALPAGNYPLTAKYTGDTNDSPSTSAPVTVTITAVIDTTKTALAANPSSVPPGTPIVLSAVVTRTVASGSPTGTVQFYSGSILLGSSTAINGTATFTISTQGLSLGTYTLTARYLGDGNDAPSTSTAVNITIQSGLSATNTKLAATPSTVTAGNIVTFKATVAESSGSGTPSGTVTFYFGAAALGTANLVNGIASFTVTTTGVPPGSYPITADYGGNTSNAASASSAVSVHVVAPTRVTLTAAPSTVNPGQAIKLTATVAETAGTATPGGSVSFLSNGVTLDTAALVNGVATYSVSTTGIPAGTYHFTANYLGDTLNAASSSPAASATVN